LMCGVNEKICLRLTKLVVSSSWGCFATVVSGEVPFETVES